MTNIENEKKQARLEEIFYAVDLLKSDLNKVCDSVKISQDRNHITLDEKVAYAFDKKHLQLERRTPRHAKNLFLLQEVTDFQVTFFPEANSILYRIEINGKEQIRGYIFLLKYANKKEE
jgi:hypothetical protein